MTRSRRNVLPLRAGIKERLDPIRLKLMETGHGPTRRRTPLQVEDLRQDWTVYQRAHLAQFIATHPGRRPWIWWIMQAPEPRRAVAMGGFWTAAHDERPETRGAEGLSFGKPRFWIPADHGKGMVFETQPEYLNRLGLLTRAEHAPAMAYNEALKARPLSMHDCGGWSEHEEVIGQ